MAINVKTIKESFSLTGVSLHSGVETVVTVKPAEEDFGVWFKRLDVPSEFSMVQAHYSNVIEGNLCTTIQNKYGVEVSTVEHLLAALAGTGVHNAIVEIDGPEVPIPVYKFSGNRRITENPKRPYGPRRMD